MLKQKKLFKTKNVSHFLSGQAFFVSNLIQKLRFCKVFVKLFLSGIFCQVSFQFLLLQL